MNVGQSEHLNGSLYRSGDLSTCFIYQLIQSLQTSVRKVLSWLPVTDKKANAELSNLSPETLLGSLEPGLKNQEACSSSECEAELLMTDRTQRSQPVFSFQQGLIKLLMVASNLS